MRKLSNQGWFKMKIVIGIIILVFIGVFVVATIHSKPKTLSFAPIKDDINNGSLLIDVRSKEEFKEAHIDGAINIAVEQIEKGALPNVAKSTKVYVYCHSGNRSSRAASSLRQAGYLNVTDLGSMSSIAADGAEIIR